MTNTPTIWRAPFTANASNTAGAQVNPYTIGLSNGNFLVVWTDDTSGPSAGSDVFGQIYGPEGDAVGTAFEVNSNFFLDGEFLGSIAPQTDGGFVIAYVDDEGAGVDAIRIERKDAAGVTILVGSITGAAGAISDPEITVAPDGSYMITFTRDIGRNMNVRAVVVSAANVIGAEFDAAQNSAEFDGISDVAGLSNNNFVTVYEEEDLDGNGIEAQIVTFAGAQVANVPVAFLGADPHVAALTGGGFAVVWNDPANNGDIRFSVLDNAGSFVANQVLVAGGANAQNEPKVVRLLDGGFFVVWDDDTSGNLTGRRFSATGAAIGGNTIIDTSASDIELGLTSDGRILVTYFNSVGEISEAILDPRDNVITGTDSSEVLTTQIGNTTIFGGSGQDTIFGQDGNDVIQGGVSTDSVFGGGGDDTIRVFEGELIDHVDGESGTDTLDLSNITSAQAVINLDTGTWQLSPGFGGPATIAGIEVVEGTQAADSVTGSGASESFSGAKGNDSLFGGGGIDTIEGGKGDDLILGGVDTDAIFGEAGSDTIAVLEGEFIDSVDGGAGQDTLDLSAIATRGAVIDLGAGTWDLSPSFGGPATIVSVERVNGTAVGDTVTGAATNEIFSGLGGDDQLNGAAGLDLLKGGNGNDTLDGGSQADTLEGGGGNDRLIGGTGQDNLTGGGGGDTFVLSPFQADRDTIADFSSAADQFEISAALFGGGLVAGVLAASQFVSNGTGLAGDADDRFIYNNATGQLFYDSNGSVGGNREQIAT
ncbi:MAG: calcium-binding protein, partial [Enhydrobacter sp.]|nr:calcium-binding protein [Enhydrobacter sp.]